MDEVFDLGDFSELLGLIPWALCEELDDSLDMYEEIVRTEESFYDALDDLFLNLEFL